MRKMKVYVREEREIDFKPGLVFQRSGENYILSKVDGPSFNNDVTDVKYGLIGLSFFNRYTSPLPEYEMLEYLENNNFEYMGEFKDLYDRKENK